ncbi:MAG: GNAT family N-acetyltransferase [Turicibacter sp.]|nr:GNAT family N-acetyltransferase [Turicibacter sp.]
MNIKISEIKKDEQKAAYTEQILRMLPDWFGIEESLQEYVKTVHNLPFWAAFVEADEGENVGDICVGFFTLKIHYGRTGDIYCCGVNPNYHGKGIGTLLFAELEKFCVAENCEYIIVKTLSEIVQNPHYLQTKKFYQKLGFVELLTLTEMWDERNPCLIMIKGV